MIFSYCSPRNWMMLTENINNSPVLRQSRRVGNLAYLYACRFLNVESLHDDAHGFWLSWLVWLVNQRQPRLSTVAVQDQRGWFRRSVIDEQHNHLAIALLGSMMRTGTIHQRRMTRRVQIESLHGAQTRPRQLPLCPSQGFVAGTANGKERGHIHSRLTIFSFYGFSRIW